MKSKEEIVSNWLPRYTGKTLESFGKYILLTNFQDYVEKFASRFNVDVEGEDRNMPSATSQEITIINFGMGSANAATVMDLLSAISPEAVLFLGKCGGINAKYNLGDFILPNAAIRHDGTSNDYLPSEVPALPAFGVQRAVSNAILNHGIEYYTGVIFTTNRRVWEHDDHFKRYLKKTRATAVDMETATIFICGFANDIPTGALLLVSDQPMISSGVKTEKSDKIVTEQFANNHINIGIDALIELEKQGQSIKQLKISDINTQWSTKKS